MIEKNGCFEFAACFLSRNWGAKSRGNFKSNKFFQSIESFLYFLSSSLLNDQKMSNKKYLQNAIEGKIHVKIQNDIKISNNFQRMLIPLKK